ncbi:MAG: UvrD-helicase domain-containing protein [Ignavibacteria bacterium]|nr:UvrD-helicase domain-containing protein [Ignavibacteria bacterium]
MSSHNLTFEQQLALMRDRHISLTANAGSGKTTVLVNKYIDILLNYEPVRNDVRRILAITFTKVAASEMKSRVAKKIDELINEEIANTTHNFEKIRKLKFLRDRIQYANIATIHSFCNSLLRDYPIEAGIAPNFFELSEFDAMALLDEAIQDVFLDFKNSPNNSDFIDLLVRYNKKNVISTIRELINFRRKLFSLIEFYKQSNDEILKYYNSALVKCYSDLFSYFDMIIDKLQEHINESEIINDIREKQSRIKAIFSKFNQAFYNSTHILDFNYLRLISEIFREKTKVNGKLQLISFLRKNFPKHFSHFEVAYKILFNKDILVLDNQQYNSLLLQQINDARLITEIASKVFDKYQNLKQEMFAIDFDDMIFLVRNMLCNQDFAKKIRNQYDYILVDEFQDTNSEQFDIISKLCFDDNSLGQDNNLFIVGDPKQSIYSFQGAEVEVFHKATSTLAQKNNLNPLIEKDKSSIPIKIDYLNGTQYSQQILNDTNKLGILSLTTSFRMSPNIAGFVNKIFSKLIGEPTPTIFELKKEVNNIKYEPIICGRATSKFIDNLVQDVATSKPLGSVSFILNNIDSKTNKSIQLVISLRKDDQQIQLKQKVEEVIASEPDINSEVDNSTEEQLIVKHIKAVIAGYLDYKVFDNETNEFRKPEYSDIAILSRKKNALGKLIKELIANNIPYVLSSGSGFFATPEIQDIREFLNFFADKNDDYAFACVLKSPFIGLTSADLFEIIAFNKQKGTQNISLYHQFLEYYNHIKQLDNYNNIKIFENANNILENLIFYSTRLNVSSLISKIISLDGYNFYVAKTPSGSQIKSNFDKLIDYARKFEARGFRSLYDFVEELQYLSDNSKEPEAAAFSNENAVRITTVHGAKGAEFPIVYIYNSNYRTKTANSFMVDKDFGLLFKLKKIIDGETSDIDFIIRNVVNHYNKADERNEEIRLFYVATTRAKDHLIISSSLTNKIQGGISKLNGFAQLLFDALQLDYGASDFETENFPDEISTELMLHNSVTPNLLKIPINVFSNSCFIVHNNPSVSAKISNKGDYHLSIKEIVSVPKNKFFYPTQLDNLLESEENFVINKEFGFDEHFLDENLSREAALSLGSAFHELIEKINEWINPDFSINVDALTEISKSISLNYFNSTAEVNYLIELVSNFYNSPFISEYKDLLLSSKREFHLVMPFESHFIGGIIDCFVEKSSNKIEIWDWKTNIIRQKSDLSVLRDKYELQMKIYAFIAFNLFHNANSINCRLFFVRSSSKINQNDWIVTFEFSRNDFELLRQEIKELINETNI